MRPNHGIRIGSLVLVGLVGSGLGGCNMGRTGNLTTGSLSTKDAKVVQSPNSADRECLARAMYFESRRTDEDGLFAVGTVVMNRLDSPKYPGSVCEVVGQNRQFATGVLTKPIRDQDRPLLDKVVGRIMAGERHDKVGTARHFHTAGYSFSYTNMHYVALAGGNQFYEKTDRQGNLPPILPHAVVMMASGDVFPIEMAMNGAAPSAAATSAPTTTAPTRTTLAAEPPAEAKTAAPSTLVAELPPTDTQIDAAETRKSELPTSKKTASKPSTRIAELAVSKKKPHSQAIRVASAEPHEATVYAPGSLTDGLPVPTMTAFAAMEAGSMARAR